MTVLHRWLLLALLLPLTGHAAPPKGSGGADCMATSGFYIVHFNAFQPGVNKDKDSGNQRKRDFQPYCRELPQTGKTYFGIDFIDRDVRKMPIVMRVVEEKTSDNNDQNNITRTLVKTPARIYNNGVAELAVDFDKPGNYALLIQIGEEPGFGDYILRIPLQVATNNVQIPFLAYAAVGAGGIFFAMMWFFLLMAFRGGKLELERKA